MRLVSLSLSVLLILSFASLLGPTPAQAGGRPQDVLVLRCGSPATPRVAITFDDGPTRKYTPRVLAILKQHGVKATFFVLGQSARREPELLRRIVAEGHLLASHSWDHPKRAPIDAWREQLRRTAEAVSSAGLKLAPYYRPPHGTVTDDVKTVCAELGYTIVLYTLLSSDWTRPGAAALERQVVRTLAPGGIVVVHDGGGDRSQTVEALPAILRGLRAKGLSPVRLDELLGPTPRLETCARNAN